MWLSLGINSRPNRLRKHVFVLLCFNFHSCANIKALIKRSRPLTAFNEHAVIKTLVRISLTGRLTLHVSPPPRKLQIERRLGNSTQPGERNCLQLRFPHRDCHQNSAALEFLFASCRRWQTSVEARSSYSLAEHNVWMINPPAIFIIFVAVCTICWLRKPSSLCDRNARGCER